MQSVDWISGATRLFGIIGDPISQVRSPEMMTAELQARGVNAILVPVHVPSAKFDDCLSGLKSVANFDGFILTIPFKSRAIGHVDTQGPEARAGGGINAMVRCADGTWKGEMFDGLGCLAALQGAGHSPQGRSVLLVGAGGAGSAIGLAVARRQPSHMCLSEVHPEKAEALAARIAAVAPGLAVEIGPPDPTGFDLVINASPMGLANRPQSPLIAPVAAGAVVFDAVANPAETRMMSEARACGASVVGGSEMIRGQVDLIVDFLLSTRNQFERDMT